MRKQIAAANWKMNLTYQEGEQLLDDILREDIKLGSHQKVIFAIPFPYLIMSKSETGEENNYEIAAQNCHHKKNGAFTGEVSVEMLKSINVRYCIIGHSERREYNLETNSILADKLDLCFSTGITPIFCCGESLSVRETNRQNDFVSNQLKDSLFHIGASMIRNIIIAYEPIWAIGTGKTATTEQAQEMHYFIRSVIADQYGKEVADAIPILYGGSVKAGNAKELFTCPDVDGGLVGGASLVATDFIEIIKSLK